MTNEKEVEEKSVYYIFQKNVLNLIPNWLRNDIEKNNWKVTFDHLDEIEDVFVATQLEASIQNIIRFISVEHNSKAKVVILLTPTKNEKSEDNIDNAPIKINDYSLLWYKQLHSEELKKIANSDTYLLTVYVHDAHVATEKEGAKGQFVDISLLEVLSSLTKQLEDKEKKISDLYNKNEQLTKKDHEEIKNLLEEANESERKIEKLTSNLNFMYSSRAWKVAHRYYTVKDKLYFLKQGFKKFTRMFFTKGPVYALRKTFNYLQNRKVNHIVAQEENPKVTKIYNELMDRYRDGEIKGIAVVPSGFIFDELYNQRTINLSKYLANKQYAVIYVPWQWDKKEKLEKSFEEVYENIYQIPLFEYLSNQIKFREFNEMKEKYFYITFPTQTFYNLINPLREIGFNIFYDVMDEWEEFQKVGQAPWYIQKIEEATVLSSDAVAVVSQPLKDKFSHIRNDIEVIGNGYTAKQLAGKDISLKEKTKDGKIHIGYFGHLTDSWFDWELIFKLLKENENIYIHIIGYGAPDTIVKKVEKMDNIKYYGKVNPTELKEHAENWHLGIIPFTEGPLSQAVDPIKIYEYLYFGLPTVVTGIGHIGSYPFVEYCKEHNQVAPAIKSFYNKLIGEQLDFDDLSNFLEVTQWSARFDAMLELAKKSNALQELYEDE